MNAMKRLMKVKKKITNVDKIRLIIALQLWWNFDKCLCLGDGNLWFERFLGLFTMGSRR